MISVHLAIISTQKGVYSAFQLAHIAKLYNSMENNAHTVGMLLKLMKIPTLVYLVKISNSTVITLIFKNSMSHRNLQAHILSKMEGYGLWKKM